MTLKSELEPRGHSKSFN